LPVKTHAFARIAPLLGSRFSPQCVDFITKQLKQSALFFHKKAPRLPCFFGEIEAEKSL